MHCWHTAKQCRRYVLIARPSQLLVLVNIPATNTHRDIEAARIDMFSIKSKDCFNNTWFADPMILGNYPDDGLKLFEKEMSGFPSDDMKTICQPLDFYGVNIYSGQIIASDCHGESKVIKNPDGPPLTTMQWRVMPESLYWGPKFLYERYKLPIVVTENGMANCDWIHRDGKVHDVQRIDFIARYLFEYKRAINDGVEAQGYFLWSIIDNFEWAHGYKQRFGIIFVNYTTGDRTLKDSAYWYKDAISSNGNML